MRIKVSLVLVAVIGLGVGYFFGLDQGWDKALRQHSHEEEIMMGHNHLIYEQAEAQEPVPIVDLVLHEDPKGGFNAQILLSNFEMAPDSVNAAPVAGEGHAHIYVDDKKINRVYGEWYYLGDLTPGKHKIAVTLSTNDHKELVQNGELISDSETVVVE